MSNPKKIMKRLNGVLFGYYQPEEIRKLSVKEINNPVAFDQISRPKKGGLYDPAMGVSPYDRFARCITCGQEGLQCPGHIGHIELLLPVYNPFLMDKLHKLLKSKCFSCHRLRISDEKIESFRIIILLLKLGYLIESLEYEKLTGSNFIEQELKRILKRNNDRDRNEKDGDASTNMGVSKSQSRKTSEADESQIQKKKTKKQTQIEQVVKDPENDSKYEEFLIKMADEIELKKEELIKFLTVKRRPQDFQNGPIITSGINKILRETISKFWESVNSLTCPHCKHKVSQIRKEGTSKFFISTKKSQVENSKTELSENENDEENENENKTPSKQVKDERSKFGNKEKPKKQNFLNPMEVLEHIKLLWYYNKDILNLIFGNVIVNEKTLNTLEEGYKIFSTGYRMFFLEVIPVPPNRFRPENKLADQTFLHGQTVTLTKLLVLNMELKNTMINKKENLLKSDASQDMTDDKELSNLEVKKNLPMKKVSKLTDTIKKWLEIQDCVNCFYDTTKAIKAADREGTGIKQILEKKEGLFRMKMMGKRVNYAARSVISPDPYLDTNEVGVPLFMAKKLSFPEYVNEYNLKKLRTLIINGPFQYPGANMIEENGNKIALETRNEQQRIALAKTLLNNFQNKIVYRHLMTGDVLLFNRQPTLHKPSIMSHIARVLPKEQTIRMHYANCNSYNADFDGDEMNLHFIQNQIARSEAYSLSLTDKQYIVPKDGKPIRGLIQDSILSSAYLTSKDRFLTKEIYQELLYIATWNIVNSYSGREKRIIILKPAILKPEPLWTGKQLISNILKVLVNSNSEDPLKETFGLNMESKAKLPAEVFGIFGKEETQVVLSDNELMQGVLDKSQIGNSEFGLIHSFYELYGSTLTGKLLTSLSRLFTSFLQINGFSCGVEDLFLDKVNENERKSLINEAHLSAVAHVANYAGLENFTPPESWNLCNRANYKMNEKGQYNSHVLSRKPDVDYISKDHEILKLLQKKVLMEKNILDELDQEMKGNLNQSTSKILRLTNNGLLKLYPDNYFSTMVLSGAKGSTVNHNQVSVMLGQQELEGRRVPVMPSGKTLPCFLPYDPNPRAGGYITDRFLSGLRPQDFFFHCMAGREGLIDTAVKTSRSGYLQRCLMKHLESLIVNYDFTVRDSDGSIVQFLYGEDSIDPTKRQFLEKFNFLGKNFKGYSQRYNPKKLASALNQKDVREYLKKRKNNPSLLKSETILSKYLPGSYLGAVSEKAYYSISDFIQSERNKTENNIFVNQTNFDEKKLFTLFTIKYFYSLITPGEAVGPTAAQSIGEPSTQMTLNTFHLAGHGGANVTLGIPRLREILMTATDKIKTPTMTLKFNDENLSKEQAEQYCRKLQRVIMLELINNIEINEKNKLSKKGKILGFEERARIYKLILTFEDMQAIKYGFGIDQNDIRFKLQKIFLPNLLTHIHKQLKKNLTKDFESKAKVVKTTEVEEVVDKKNQDEDEDVFKELDENTINNQLKEHEQHSRKNSDDSQKPEGEEEKKEEALKSNDNADMGGPFKQYLKKFAMENNKCIIKFKLPLDSKKLLMINLVELILSNTLVYEIKGITKTHLLKKEKMEKVEYQIQTEGVNYKACWNCPFIDVNKIYSNDIQSIFKTYGVEAARNSIIKEINNVFSAYHISVDYRHLALIADYMSFSGEIKAMNRTGIQDSASSFLKMSYETTMNFLTHASTYKENDTLQTPSSQIVLGRVAKVGTGMFDVLYKLK